MRWRSNFRRIFLIFFLTFFYILMKYIYSFDLYGKTDTKYYFT